MASLGGAHDDNPTSSAATEAANTKTPTASQGSHDEQDEKLCDKCRAHFAPTELDDKENSCPFLSTESRLTDREEEETVLFTLGPFQEALDEISCAFCQIARHAVGLYDGHPTQIILVLWENFRPKYRIERHDKALQQMADYNESHGLGIGTVKRFQGDQGNEDTQYTIPLTESDAASQTRVWISDCEGSHAGCSKGDNSAYTPTQGVYYTHIIDVQQRRLVKVNSLSGSASSERYFALSYVNGGANFLELTSDNEFELCSPGALSVGVIPRTFNDAIEFTQQCGFRYVWIDALCIRQGNKQEVERQIRCMQDIYHLASLVLIARLGNTPHFGLYARSPPTKNVCGLDLAPSSEFDGVMTYDTRAWCFQEGCLARRTLTFAADCIRYRCNHTVQQAKSAPLAIHSIEIEDASAKYWWTPIASTSRMRNIGFAHDLDRGRKQHDRSSRFFDKVLLSYNDLLTRYLACSLTYQLDIAKAFAGISDLIARSTSGDVVHGLPTVLFPVCLFWVIAEDTIFEKDRGPSWSWTSRRIPAELTQDCAIPYMSLHMNYYGMVRFIHIDAADAFAAPAAACPHGKQSIMIDVAKNLRMASNAVELQPAVPSLGSAKCQAMNGVLHFEGMVTTIQGFIVETKRHQFRNDNFDVLFMSREDDVGGGKRLAGFLYGLSRNKNPWRQVQDPSAGMGSTSTFLVAMAMISNLFQFILGLQGDDGKDLDFQGEYYACLIVSKEELDVTCERIGLAMIRKEIFDECNPEQRMIHLV